MVNNMSCSNPHPALDLGYKINDKGDRVRNIKFLDMQGKYIGYGLEELKEKYGDSLLLLPCGHCYMCSLDYAKQWSARIMLEAKYHKKNCFITLTYNDWFLPEKPQKRHWQLFMKRLRKEVGWPIRFFACGEKGDKSGRSHMHAIIFGYDFPDKVELKRSASGLMIYRSPTLEKLWPFGISSIGDVSPESAQYVAKYSMKKKLSGIDTGEFVLMSRRPGLGVQGYDPSDYVTDKLYLNGKKFKMPRYFDKITEANGYFPGILAKYERIERARQFASKKYQFNLHREEEALKKIELDRIDQDCFKVRLSI